MLNIYLKIHLYKQLFRISGKCFETRDRTELHRVTFMTSETMVYVRFFGTLISGQE